MESKLIRFALKLDLPVGELPKPQYRVCRDCAHYSDNIPQYSNRETKFCGIGAPQLIINGLCPARTPLEKRI